MNIPNPFSPSEATLTREQLIERIRNSSKDEVILSEMQRLGFWPSDRAQPTAEETLIRREVELSKALQTLSQELHAIQDPVAAFKAMRKERMAKARERREETRQKRARERYARAAAWHQRRQKELLYLGEGVSAGLSAALSDIEKLQRNKLPVLHTAQDLASAMGVAMPELRFLAFDRRVSRISHYQRFAMPKKTGGERIISAPMPRLKRAQYWVLDNLLARMPLHQAAHGFTAGRSIVTNALPHVGRAVVINLDLKDFFPSIHMPRIKGVFRSMGYSEQIAATLALLCTESATEEVLVDGEKYFVAHGRRALPQGAPTSPALTNLLCRALDARLQASAAKLGFRYTRYADDLTFSADAPAAKAAGKMLWRAKQIVIGEGFTPHPDKQHVMRQARRQEVTGVVVNRKATVDRDTLRRFRATLYQVEKDGPAGKHWNGNSDVLVALEGYAQFIRMVDAERGAPLLARVRAARVKWPRSGVAATAAPATRHGGDFRALAASGKAPWDNWWQPAAPPAPVLEKTAEQIAQEKRAANGKPESKRRADNAARSAASTATSSPPRASAAPQPEMPRVMLLTQIFVAIWLTIGSGGIFTPLVAGGTIAYNWKKGEPNWSRFIIAILVGTTMDILLRPR